MAIFPWDHDAVAGLPDLPEPDVEFATCDMQAGEFTGAGIKGILMNPIYARVGKFPAIVSEKQWVAACKEIMAEESPEQFLVNLLFLLRSTFGRTGGEEGP